MNLGARESSDLALLFKNELKGIEEKDLVVCPSFTALAKVREILQGSRLALGAQDVFWEEKGSYTGEESPKFLAELGCEYVLVGHSERREKLGEDNEMIHKKVKACIAGELVPIVCVGENFEERQEGLTNQTVLNEIFKALAGVDLVPKERLIIAYEPVWVIGSGRAVEPEEAGEVFRLIRQAVLDLWPLTIVENSVRIIYGGSVDGNNAGKFAGLEYFNGFLVGGASLRAEEFKKIVNSF